MRRNVTAVLALTSGVGAAILLVTGASMALALPNEPNITLCHATPPDTAAQGYVEITVDANAIFKQGHDSEHDEDIIPEFDYTDAEGNTVHYPGKNLDNGGEAILENGCEAVAPPTTTPPPTTTETTTTETTTTETTTTDTTTTDTTTTDTTTTTTDTTTDTTDTTTDTTTTDTTTTGSQPSQTGGGNNPPRERQVPSGPVDAGGSGLYEPSPSSSAPAILLVTGGLLTGASTALTIRWRRQTV